MPSECRLSLCGSHVHQFYWFKGPCFLPVIHQLWLLSFCPPLPCVTLSSEGRDVMQVFYLEQSISRLHILCIISDSGSVYFFPICSRRKHLWWWIYTTILNYKYSRISLVVVLYLLSLTVVLVLPLVLGLSSMRSLMTKTLLGMTTISLRMPYIIEDIGWSFL